MTWKPNSKHLTTPATTVGPFVHVTQPSTNFDPDGVYSIDLIYDQDSDSYKALKTKLDAFYAEELARALQDPPGPVNEDGTAFLKMADKPWEKPVLDRDKKVVPGKVKVSVKEYAIRRDRKTNEVTRTNKVVLYDAAAEPIDPSTINPWEGSIARASVMVMPWYVASLGFGVKLQLKAVQFLKVVEGVPQTAEGHGFAPEPDEDLEMADISPEGI